MTFISDRYDVYPVMDHPARATLDLYIVSICNDLAGKFDFLGKSSSFFRVIEPRDRRRMRAGFARSCGEAIWPALRCRQPCWGLSSLALLGPLLIGPVGGCPGSRSRRSASLATSPRSPALVTRSGGSQKRVPVGTEALVRLWCCLGGGCQDAKTDPTTKKARQPVLFGTSWRAAIGVERSSHFRTDPQAGSVRTNTDR